MNAHSWLVNVIACGAFIVLIIWEVRLTTRDTPIACVSVDLPVVVVCNKPYASYTIPGDFEDGVWRCLPR